MSVCALKINNNPGVSNRCRFFLPGDLIYFPIPPKKTLPRIPVPVIADISPVTYYNQVIVPLYY